MVENLDFFHNLEFKEYLAEFKEGLPISQQIIDILELREKYLIEMGKNKEISGKLREARKLIKDLKRNKTISKRHENQIKALRDSNDFGKIPPQNVALEEIILGSYLNFPKLMSQGEYSQSYLNLMWYKESHLMIHSAMMNSKKKVNIENVVTEIKRTWGIDLIGGREKIESLYKNEGISEDISTIDEYIEELESCFKKRELIAFSTELSKLAYDESLESISETIRDKSAELWELLPFRYRKRHDKKASVIKVKENLRELNKRKGLPKISTGFKKLDAITHGILPGKLLINGARGKMGKSVFTMGIAKNVSKQGYDVAYFNHEFQMEEMINRLLSSETGIAFSRFEYNPQGFTKEEEDKIEQELDKIEKSNLYLERGRAPNVDYIVNRSKQLKTIHPDLSLIVFDGLQAYGHLVPDRANKSDFFTKILEKMKYEIADQLGVAVYLNAQLRTDVDTKYKKSLCKPRSSEDFSDCKGLKDICDGIFGLWRGEYYFPKNKHYKNRMKIIPFDLRSEDRNIKPIDIGCDMKTMSVYEI